MHVKFVIVYVVWSVIGWLLFKHTVALVIYFLQLECIARNIWVHKIEVMGSHCAFAEISKTYLENKEKYI